MCELKIEGGPLLTLDTYRIENRKGDIMASGLWLDEAEKIAYHLATGTGAVIHIRGENCSIAVLPKKKKEAA